MSLRRLSKKNDEDQRLEATSPYLPAVISPAPSTVTLTGPVTVSSEHGPVPSKDKYDKTCRAVTRKRRLIQVVECVFAALGPSHVASFHGFLREFRLSSMGMNEQQ
jgi:hypothetical protein